jgi:hypothetical protein
MKKFSPLLAAAAFTAILIPAGAQAATSAPIGVEECAVQQLTGSVRDLSYSTSFATSVDGLRVSFVNHGSTPATSVDFLVRYGGRSYDIVANGTFTSGVPVTQDFDGIDNAPFSGDAAQCAVRSATFADGTAWRAEDL